MKGIKLRKAIAALMVSALAVNTFAVNANAFITNDNATAPVANSTTTQNNQRKLIGYFAAWGYNQEVRNYHAVTDLQWDELTHIQYSFAGVGKDNKIQFLDQEAAIDTDFDGRKFYWKGEEIKMDPNLPYKGHFNIIQQMKKKYPDTKVVMSVGGWAASRGFYEMMDTEAGMETFANSCVDFIRKYDLDGIDIDFEYPSATKDSGNPADFDVSNPRRGTINASYNKMMKKLHEKISAAEKQDGKDYVLSAALTASAWVLGGVDDNTYTNYLDFVSVMSYDYHGGWNEFVENQANIYPDKNDKETIQMAMPTLSMDWTYRYYRGVVPSEKILMGVPFYTRGWENVQGGEKGLHGTSKTPAAGPDNRYNIWGDDDNGDGVPDPAGANPLWHVLNLADQAPEKWEIVWDDIGKVPHAWNESEKTFLTFENERSIDERVKYIKDKNLGGALIWEMSGDFGLNPNYVPGSTKVNEGKYTFGNTLTKKLSDGFKAMGDYKISNEAPVGETKPVVGNFEVHTSMKYDHPNGENTITLKGINGVAAPKSYEIEFDVPNSATKFGVEGGTIISETPSADGVFTHIKIKSSEWSDFVKFKSVLCYSGLRNIRVNGMVPANIPINGNFLPTMSGVSNKKIAVGSTFNKMAGVTAKDTEDGDLTSAVRCVNGVKPNEEGFYNLEYVVKDSTGMEATAKSIVYVLPQKYINVPIYDPSATYANGNEVLYNGSIYKAIGWWIPPGTLPTSTAHFEKVYTLADKTFVEGNIEPEYAPEDVNKDGRVNVTDLSLVASAYNAKKGEAKYKAEYDLKANNLIDLYDLVVVGKAVK